MIADRSLVIVDVKQITQNIESAIFLATMISWVSKQGGGIHFGGDPQVVPCKFSERILTLIFPEMLDNNGPHSLI